MFNLTRLDVCGFLFSNTYFNNDRTREMLNFILCPFALQFPWFIAIWEDNKHARCESGSFNHLGAFYSTYFARHRCRCREIFGGAKDFCANFSKLAQNVFGL